MKKISLCLLFLCAWLSSPLNAFASCQGLEDARALRDGLNASIPDFLMGKPSLAADAAEKLDNIVSNELPKCLNSGDYELTAQLASNIGEFLSAPPGQTEKY